MPSPPPPPPPPTHILETILYVRSLSHSRYFYTTTLGLKCVGSSDRSAVFPLGAGVLLLFQLGATGEDHTMPDDGGLIPKHGPTEGLLPYLIPSNNDSSSSSGGDGSVPPGPNTGALGVGGERLRQHFCFAVNSAEDVDAWNEYLVTQGVEILGRVRWPEERGRSVYFADPNGNVGEVASRGIWDHLKKQAVGDEERGMGGEIGRWRQGRDDLFGCCTCPRRCEGVSDGWRM